MVGTISRLVQHYPETFGTQFHVWYNFTFGTELSCQFPPCLPTRWQCANFILLNQTQYTDRTRLTS